MRTDRVPPTAARAAYQSKVRCWKTDADRLNGNHGRTPATAGVAWLGRKQIVRLLAVTRGEQTLASHEDGA
jgi:hypothetical protein